MERVVGYTKFKDKLQVIIRTDKVVWGEEDKGWRDNGLWVQLPPLTFLTTNY
jgi:hypothetical protein